MPNAQNCGCNLVFEKENKLKEVEEVWATTNEFTLILMTMAWSYLIGGKTYNVCAVFILFSFLFHFRFGGNGRISCTFKMKWHHPWSMVRGANLIMCQVIEKTNSIIIIELWKANRDFYCAIKYPMSKWNDEWTESFQ